MTRAGTVASEYRLTVTLIIFEYIVSPFYHMIIFDDTLARLIKYLKHQIYQLLLLYSYLRLYYFVQNDYVFHSFLILFEVFFID